MPSISDKSILIEKRIISIKQEKEGWFVVMDKLLLGPFEDKPDVKEGDQVIIIME